MHFREALCNNQVCRDFGCIKNPPLLVIQDMGILMERELLIKGYPNLNNFTSEHCEKL